ncbi:MAG: TlpA disulfide reductase family protein [Betaproteobacteria bacterium]
MISGSNPLPPSVGRRRRFMLGGLGRACLAGGAWLASRQDAGQADTGGAAVHTFLATAWTDAEGKPFDSASLRGRPMVINFWATWCPPCVEEMPELDTLQRELAPKGVQVIGIGIDSAAKIEQFSKKSGFSYPLLQGGASGAELTRAFGNASAALPFTVVIDRDGRVRDRILGRFRLDTLRKSALVASG